MRKPKNQQEEDDDYVAIDVESGSHHHQTLIDPLTPLPGGVKLKTVSDQRPPRKKPGEAKAGKSVYSQYLSALVKYQGDEVMAMSDVLGLPQSEVEERKLELHESILEQAGQGRSLRKIFEESDLSKEARAKILRSHAYSSNAAASLKAISMVEEADQERVADINSYESYLRDVLGGRKRR